MDLQLTSGDFAIAVDDPDIREKLLTRAVYLDETRDEVRVKLMDAIPKALARKVEMILPADYCVKEIELTVKLSGEFLGVGLSGDAKIKFGPRANS